MTGRKKRIIVGLTGASSTNYAIDFVSKLKDRDDVETHGIISKWAVKNIQLDTDISIKEIQDMFDYTYSDHNVGAIIASGSFQTDGMVVIPASMKTVAAISIGLGDNLISRAADVTLKENRKLIISPRETPLNAIHLENLLKLARLGVMIVPPIPAFYHRPESIQDLMDHHSMKLMDLLGIENEAGNRWEGM